MNDLKAKQREAGYQPASFATGTRRDLKPLEDLTAYIQEYSRQRPETVALACIAVGFILGWKLKLW